MNIVWSDTVREIVDDNGLRYTIETKPVFTFDYDALYYEPSTSNYFYFLDDARIVIDTPKIAELDSYLGALTYVTYDHAVDQNGEYVGKRNVVLQNSSYVEVASAPPNDGNYYWDGTVWQYIYGVDENDQYIGNVPLSLCATVADSEPSFPLTTWDIDTGTWIDSRSFEQHKADKLLEINQARDSAIAGGFTWNSYTWGSSSIDRENIVAAVSAFTAGIPVPVGFTWRTDDNQNIAMTQQDMVDLGSALLDHVQYQYSYSWSLKDQVEAVIDSETAHDDLDAISWS